MFLTSSLQQFVDKLLNGESPYAELSNSYVRLSNEYFPFCFQSKTF